MHNNRLARMLPLFFFKHLLCITCLVKYYEFFTDSAIEIIAAGFSSFFSLQGPNYSQSLTCQESIFIVGSEHELSLIILPRHT